MRSSPTSLAPIFWCATWMLPRRHALKIRREPLSASGVCSATRIVKETKMRFGRLWLDSAYGSELLDLKLSLQVQYWNGNSWAFNGSDVYTGSSLSVNGVGLSNYSGLSSTEFGSSHIKSFASAESGKSVSEARKWLLCWQSPIRPRPAASICVSTLRGRTQWARSRAPRRPRSTCPGCKANGLRGWITITTRGQK